MSCDKSIQANNFVAALKANGSENDVHNLEKVHEDYISIANNLSGKDKGAFSLNVLCILCRNLDKVPNWCDRISNNHLLQLSIECFQNVNGLEKPDQIKKLACFFHIHKYVTRQNTPLPPEFVLKLSYLPFQIDSGPLFKEHCKTYWGIITDRFVYLEKLKTRKAILKLLPKLTEDILTIIELYESVQFCKTNVLFVIKKLYYLFNNSAKDLKDAYKKIFDCIASKNDHKSFKDISEAEMLDVYLKLSDCLYVVAENDCKLHFKESILDSVVRTVMSLVGYRSDMFHCLQTFYLNCFCCVFNDKVNSVYTERVLNSFVASCDMSEKLGYVKLMYETYPFLAQFLRLYIEYYITNCDGKKWADNFDISVQKICLEIILFLVKKLSRTQQIVKCENCNVRTGLHDALRLTFLTKSFISLSISQELNVSDVLPVYISIVEQQYNVLNVLKKLGCVNHGKCYQKLQTGVHNTAICLNKAKSYVHSTKFFDIYIKNEFSTIKNAAELKNIARALYNKSINELDSKSYKSALMDAYLSLAFSESGGDISEKYMNLVMDIKAKVLNEKDLEGEWGENQDYLLLMTVLTACKCMLENGAYGNLELFLSSSKFSVLLKHEFLMYVKLWPSVVPIAGVWNSLYQLLNKEHTWCKVEKEDSILKTLYEVVLTTPSVVRTIHSEHYKEVVIGLLGYIDKKSEKTIEEKLVQATLLFLTSEYEIEDASLKYGWKASVNFVDPDQVQQARTLPQEHRVLLPAVQAVHIWTEILPHINSAPVSTLRHCLHIAEVFVQHFEHMHRCVQSMQLAHVCCKVAHHIGDGESYMRNAVIILSKSNKECEEVDTIIFTAKNFWAELFANPHTRESVFIFTCELGMYYQRCGLTLTAVKLLQHMLANIMETISEHPDVKLDFAIGSLLETRPQFNKEMGLSTLSAVNVVQKYYCTITNHETRWCHRRIRVLHLKRRLCSSGAYASSAARALRLWRRARSSAGVALPAASAATAARLHATITDCNSDDAQVKIDNRLKHILGLQPTNETQLYDQQAVAKNVQHTPRHAQMTETMLECAFRKVQLSPTLPCMSVPTFKTPEFLTHDNKCLCYACDMPYSFIIAIQTCFLEASKHYRAKDLAVARNHFDGTFKALSLVQRKLNAVIQRYKSRNFQKYILDMIKDAYNTDLRNIEVEALIEATFLELTQNNQGKADDRIVNIHEIIQDYGPLTPYLESEVHNLLVAAARLRRVKRKPTETGLEDEMENLKLSPNTELQKTPVSKQLPPPKTSKVVKGDEVPIMKRKVIKLSLDEESSDEKEPIEDKKPEFKVPTLMITKPVLETMTPAARVFKSKLTHQTAVDYEEVSTPSSANVEFFTPSAATPAEFFTPMSTLKTYSRRPCNNIVKNLENEFSTPKAGTSKRNGEKPKSEVRRTRSKVLNETGSTSTIKNKKSLKHSTSPGSLEKEEKTTTRSRRVRQYVDNSKK